MFRSAELGLWDRCSKYTAVTSPFHDRRIAIDFTSLVARGLFLFLTIQKLYKTVSHFDPLNFRPTKKTQRNGCSNNEFRGEGFVGTLGEDVRQLL